MEHTHMHVDGSSSAASNAAMGYWCSGDEFRGYGGLGNGWIGHFLPGLLMILWGTHWTIAIFCKHIGSTKHAPYRAQAAHRFVLEPKKWQLESWVKLLLPPIAICFELWLGHPSYRYDLQNCALWSPPF